jgi:two-component system, chemotaxis family, CheB/CheR fusion protein
LRTAAIHPHRSKLFPVGRIAFRRMKKMRVVGIGGSEGALGAYGEVFAAIPPDTGFAFVVMNHPLPGWKSLLPETLASHTQMPVIPMTEGDYLRANTIYVNPPDATVTLVEGEFIFLPRSKSGGWHTSISLFFRSLAKDQEDRAIAVILSGQGEDGTDALQSVKESGGLTLAQLPSSAKSPGMPESACATGFVDYCLAPREIGEKLHELSGQESSSSG